MLKILTLKLILQLIDVRLYLILFKSLKTTIGEKIITIHTIISKIIIKTTITTKEGIIETTRITKITIRTRDLTTNRSIFHMEATIIKTGGTELFNEL